MSARLYLLLPLAIAALTIGCIEPVTGAADTSKTDITFYDTTSHDTTLSDTTTLTCTPADCDDGDPCSADWCDTTTGQCEHAFPPVAEPGAPMPIASCASAAECDDGDPCTADSCETVGELCVGPATPSFCVNRAVPGCGFGCDAPRACDDGKVCTVDTCVSGSCYNLLLDGCSNECTAEGVPTASQAGMGRFPGESIAALGQAWMWQNDMFCTDDGLCNCEGSIALRDAGGALLLRAPPTANPGDRWRCDNRDGRTPEIACSPMHAGVSYVTWGVAGYSWDAGPAFAAAPLPTSDAVMVAGWCLEPTSIGLSGQYDGQISDSWGSPTITFKAKIHQEASGTTALSISSAQCLDNACDAATAIANLPDQTVSLTIWSAGGRADFKFNSSGVSQVAWRFFGQHNNLSGRWVGDFAAYGFQWEDPASPQTPTPDAGPPADSGRADVAPPPEGWMTLTRVAPPVAGGACQ